MKYVLFSVVILAVVVSGCLTVSQLQGEIYEGTAAGCRGPIRVRVRMNGSSIMDIAVVDSSEDRFVGEAAMEELIDLVIECNSTDVDVISGATVTSKGFLEAVNNAIMGL
jgi:urocanate reductase